MIKTFCRQLPFLILLLVCGFFFTIQSVSAQTTGISWSGSDANLYGYAWSDTIGWISMNCNQSPAGGSSNCDADGGYDYGVYIDDADGTLHGYAWSDNIGWIKFDSLSVFPSSNFTNASVKTQDASGNDYLYGWIRACAGTENGDCSTMTDHPDGWDGWVSLNCANHDVINCDSYRVRVQANGQFDGYAWGGDVLGWISFDGVGYEVEFDQPCTPALACSAELDAYIETNQWCVDLAEVSCDTGYYCVENLGCEAEDMTYTFSVSQTLINPGTTVTLDWTVENADSCTVVGNNGDSWDGLDSTSAAYTGVGLGTDGPTVNTSPLDYNSNRYTLSCVTGGVDIISAEYVTDNTALEEGGVIENLFDNDTDTFLSAETGTMFVEFDLGEVLNNLTRARIYGDDDGSWFSETWSLFYKVNATDSWTAAFEDSDAFGFEWFSEDFGVTARYMRLEIKSSSGRVRFGEFELYDDTTGTASIELDTVEVNLVPEVIES